MESARDGKKLCKRPEIDEEPEIVSQEAGRNISSGVSECSTHQIGDSSGISADSGISELEQMLKRMTFTRSETQHLIAVLYSRTIQESPSRAAISSSRALEEETYSLAELANAYKGSSTIANTQAPRQDSKMINNKEMCLPKTPMASPQHPATIENLPDEVLVNIFIRLLAKQLAQMRSVSKPWNALLSQSSFVKSHLNRSIQTSHQTLLHFSDEYLLGVELLVNPLPHLTNCIKLPVNPQSRRNDIKVIGSVNGLICSSYSDFVDIHIWNPSLSAITTLPPYSTPSESYEWIRVYFRFGIDPKTNDYKVVKLTGFGEKSYGEVTWWMDVEIYSMRKGSWKLITERVPSHITWIDDNEVVCVDGHDGYLHWLGCIDDDSKTIMAFNLGLETFCEIPVPHSTLDNKYHCSKSLGFLAGKLCIITWAWGAACEVWVMEEYRVAESWVKRHVFSQFIGDTYPFGFTSANKFLIQDHYCRLVLYDPVTRQARILKNDCSYEEYHAGKIVEYVDSLVWVAPDKHEMVDGVRLN